MTKKDNLFLHINMDEMTHKLHHYIPQTTIHIKFMSVYKGMWSWKSQITLVINMQK